MLFIVSTSHDSGSLVEAATPVEAAAKYIEKKLGGEFKMNADRAQSYKNEDGKDEWQAPLYYRSRHGFGLNYDGPIYAVPAEIIR